MEIARSLHCWIFGKHPFVVTSDACKMFEEDDKQYEESCRSKLRNVSSDFQLDHYSASDMRDFNADKYLPAAINNEAFTVRYLDKGHKTK